MKNQKTLQASQNEVKKKEVTLVSKQPTEGYLSSASEGLSLPPHQAKMVWQGNKSIIVGPNFSQLVGKLLYIIGGNDCYGIISLKNSKPIGLKEFEELEEKHRVSKDERKSRWHNMQSFDACEFDMVKRFDKPKRVPASNGNTYLEKVEFLEEAKRPKPFRDKRAVDDFLSDVSSSKVFSYLTDKKGFLNKVKEMLASKEELLAEEDLSLFEGVQLMGSERVFENREDFKKYLFGD